MWRKGVVGLLKQLKFCELLLYAPAGLEENGFESFEATEFLVLTPACIAQQLLPPAPKL